MFLPGMPIANPAPIMTAPKNAVPTNPEAFCNPAKCHERLHPSQAMPARWPMQGQSVNCRDRQRWP